MLLIEIKSIMQAKSMRLTHTLLIRMGMSNNTARALLKGNATTIKLKHLENLCMVLNCTPNDLMVWDPPIRGKTVYYALHKLRRPGIVAPKIASTLSNLKPEDFNRIMKLIEDNLAKDGEE